MGERRGDVDSDVVPARQVAADFAQRLPLEDQFTRGPAGFQLHVAATDVQLLCGGVVAGDFTGVQLALFAFAGVEGHRTLYERYGDGPVFERGVHVEFGAVNPYAQPFHFDREGAFGIFGNVEKSLSAKLYVAAFGAEGAVADKRRAALEPYGRTVGQVCQRFTAEGAELLSGRTRCEGGVGMTAKSVTTTPAATAAAVRSIGTQRRFGAGRSVGCGDPETPIRDCNCSQSRSRSGV